MLRTIFLTQEMIYKIFNTATQNLFRMVSFLFNANVFLMAGEAVYI